MPDFLAVVLSLVLPWLAGAVCVLALQRAGARRDTAVALGYGYLLGALVTTLAMRALDATGVHWTAALIAMPLIALIALAGWFGCRPFPPLAAQWRQGRDRLAVLSSSQRALFWICLALVAVRLAGLGLELAWRPLLPWDAWAQWATKAKVWYAYRSLVAFVDPAQWLAAGAPMQFVDAHSEYPATVPLLQVWTALNLGRWDESLINAPWLAMLVSLGIAFYAQLRRIGVGVAKAMLITYLLLSIPFIDLHVAVAGYVDLFIAAAYGLAAMALWQWTRTRRRVDAVLALLGAIACIAFKKEGIVWALTLLPPALVAIDRRLGLRVAAALIVAVVLYLSFGPAEVTVLGYTLRTQFANVSRPLLEHFFEMDNWHLLWYLALAVVALRARLLLSAAMAPMTVTMAGAFGFVFIVFFFSSAAGGVADETLVNRLPLQLVPALAFYLVLLWREAPELATGAATAAARPAA